MKQIVQLAIEDHKSALEQVRHDSPLTGSKLHVAPLVVRLQYYEAALDPIERGQLDTAKLERSKSKELREVTERY